VSRGFQRSDDRQKIYGELRGIIRAAISLTGSMPFRIGRRLGCARVSPKSRRDRWRATRSFRVARFLSVHPVCERPRRLSGHEQHFRSQPAGAVRASPHFSTRFSRDPAETTTASRCRLSGIPRRAADRGLAPGMHGANRTGRPFTGDHAGILLYATLFKFGLATGPTSTLRRTTGSSSWCANHEFGQVPTAGQQAAAFGNQVCNEYLRAELAAKPRPPALFWHWGALRTRRCCARVICRAGRIGLRTERSIA
jgi:hypothetical protein